jgi:hypothetical protein
LSTLRSSKKAQNIRAGKSGKPRFAKLNIEIGASARVPDEGFSLLKYSGHRRVTSCTKPSAKSAGYGSPWPMAARYAQVVEKVYVDIPPPCPKE